MKDRVFVCFFACLAIVVTPTVIQAEQLKRFSFIPILASTPETGLMAGLFTLQNFDKTVRAKNSRIQYLLIYTSNQQSILRVAPVFINNKNTQIYRLGFGYKNFPTNFYGIGNNTLKENEEPYGEEAFDTQFSFEQLLFKNIYSKISFKYNQLRLYDLKADGKLIDLTTEDTQNYSYLTSSLGLVYDTRDNENFTSSGHFHTFQLGNIDGQTDREFHTLKWSLDSRYYHLWKKHNMVLAANFWHQNLSGDYVPFQLLPKLGGAKVLRGYFAGRYRSRWASAFQTEIRKLWATKHAATVFAGFGRVGSNQGDWLSQNWHRAYGFGYLYFIDTVSKLHLRLNLGFSKQGTSFYFQVNQAF